MLSERSRSKALDLRGGVRSERIAGAQVIDRQAARFLPDGRAREADPAAIVSKAREEEADGLDSALVTLFSSWPDPWLVAGWALAATQRLRVTVAHRPGVQQPTAAARSLATLDRLSGGRAAVHIVIGSSDTDVRRDGDMLGKDERYARAAEYLDIFTRSLEAEEPFDHHGEHYRVTDAWLGFRPAQRPRPPISIGGSSDQALHLAARHADIYAGAFTTPQDTAKLISHLEGLGPVRQLRYWKHFKVILGESDLDARRRAETLRRRGEAQLGARSPAELGGGAQTARDRERTGEDPENQDGTRLREWAINTHRDSFDRVITGSVDTVAAQILAFRDAGIDIVQIEATTEDEVDRALRRELIARLRDAV